MLAITLDGQMGAGCPEVGMRLARGLGGQYVERSALRRTTRRLGATVEAVSRKELAFGKKWTRFGQVLELWFTGLGRYPQDPAFDGAIWDGMEPLDVPQKKTLPAQISDREYRQAIFDTAAEYSRVPNIVLGRRAGCVALREVPDVVHVGLFAPLDARIARTCNRFGIGPGEAQDLLNRLEQARAGWFDHLGRAHPHDRSLYHVAVECEKFPDEVATSRFLRNVVFEIGSGTVECLQMSDGY